MSIPEWIDPPDRFMPAPKIVWNDGMVAAIFYANLRGQTSRKNGPASIHWYANGIKEKEVWLRHGECHRTSGPAVIMWHPNGIKAYEQWYHKGKLHRTDGPADIYWGEDGILRQQEWHHKGKTHREDGPAKETWNTEGVKTSEQWLQKNELHRIDGPAYTHWKDGIKHQEEWYTHGNPGGADGIEERYFDAEGNATSERLVNPNARKGQAAAVIMRNL